MKQSTFEEKEVPYEILEKFGLTHEMIEDLPLFALDDIANGKPSPVLPIRIKDDNGHTVKSMSKFALVRVDDKVDVMFYPVLRDMLRWIISVQASWSCLKKARL